MILPLPRKHPITVPGRITWPATTVSLLVLWLAWAGQGWAQQAPGRLPRWLPFRSLSRTAGEAGETTMHFSRAPVVSPGSEFYPTTAVQDPKGETPRYGRPKKDEEEVDSQIYTELPGPDRLFRRDSETEWKERIRQDERKQAGAGKVDFPQGATLEKEVQVLRMFPRALKFVEPSFVCHRRLIFEQTNFERLGYDLGVMQPGLSMGIFYFDMLTLPYQYCKRPLQQFDCSTGKCLPGDPSPMVLDPPEWSATGLLGEAAAIGGLIVAFP